MVGPLKVSAMSNYKRDVHAAASTARKRTHLLNEPRAKGGKLHFRIDDLITVLVSVKLVIQVVFSIYIFPLVCAAKVVDVVVTVVLSVYRMRRTNALASIPCSCLQFLHRIGSIEGCKMWSLRVVY